MLYNILLQIPLFTMTKKIYIKYFVTIILVVTSLLNINAQDIDANTPRANDKVQKKQIEYQDLGHASTILEASDTINVIYDRGETDYPIFISYKDRMQNINSIPTDTLIKVTSNDFDKLKQLIINNNIKEETAVCDVRMILNIKSNYLFIGTFNTACNEKNENVHLTLESLYFINSITERYNYIHYEDLMLLEEILKYGVPANYIDINRKKNCPKRKSPRVKIQIVKATN